MPLSSFLYDCGRISFVGVLMASSSLWGQVGQAARPAPNTPASTTAPSTEAKGSETEDSITFLFARRLRMFYTLKIGNKNIRQFKEWVTALPGTPL